MEPIVAEPAKEGQVPKTPEAMWFHHFDLAM